MLNSVARRALYTNDKLLLAHEHPYQFRHANVWACSQQMFPILLNQASLFTAVLGMQLQI